MRLSNATLAHLPAAIARPRYDRAALGHGIVHLGIGAFHRAHQAVYTEAALNAGDLRWGITAASFRSPATRDALAPQDGLYTLELRAEADAQTVIGAIRSVLVTPEAPQAILAALTHPETRIVTLTITEKAYTDDAAGPIATLVEALRHRRAAGLPPFTVVSCDNLPHNGRTTHALLTRIATDRDPDLGAWIAAEVACPSTMVDRIVPATTEADRARIAERLGMADAWPVVAEPFIQWVIEDRFPTGRPEWERGGASFVADVAPFEAMKLRLLNASHSALAYMGQLAGCETVADAMANPALAAFAARLMHASTPSLSLPPGADVEGYIASLLARFRNPALRHRTAQIAMDGSQKIPQRWLATMRDLLAQGRSVATHAEAVAAWLRFIARGGPLDDPMAPQLRAAAAVGPDAVLALTPIFGDLPANPTFRAEVSAALRRPPIPARPG